MGKFKAVFRAFGLGSKKIDAPEAPTAPPTRDDAEVLKARSREELALKLKKGRRASILTSGRGVQEELGSVERPQASRGSTLLGGT